MIIKDIRILRLSKSQVRLLTRFNELKNTSLPFKDLLSNDERRVLGYYASFLSRPFITINVNDRKHLNSIRDKYKKYYNV